MTSNLEAYLDRVRQGLSLVEIVHMPHDRWPLPRQPTHTVKSPFRVSVLDSSFNPPTLAHLALANISYASAFGSSSLPFESSTTTESPHPDFHAKLLLLSVRNADKVLKAGDATYLQRLEMMSLLAQDVRDGGGSVEGQPDGSGSEGGEGSNANVAVAIIDEPTFVGKSSILLDFLRSRLSTLCHTTPVDATASAPPQTIDGIPSLELTFVVGVDTLERLFAPRYYSSEEVMHSSLEQLLSPQGDNSRVICARRITPGLSQKESDSRVIELAQTFIDRGRILVVDIDESVRSLSSSAVRASKDRSSGSWDSMMTSRIIGYVQSQNLYAAST